MAIKQDVVIIHPLHVSRNVYAIKLQDLLGCDQNLIRAEHPLCYTIVNQQVRCWETFAKGASMNTNR